MIPSFFIGLWPLVWHFGIIYGVMGLALAFAWFSPVFKKTALWIALGAFLLSIAAATYTKLGEQRVQAQWDAAKAHTQSQVERAVRDAGSTRAGGVRDRWDNDKP